MQKHLLTAMAALCVVVAAAQPTAGLVSYWTMNGNLTSSGPTSINITNTNVTATTNAAGTINTAMAFNNPTGSVVSFGTVTPNASLNFTGDFSIDFAFYINSPYVHAMGFFDNGINSNASSAFGYGVWFWNPGGANRLVINCRNGAVQSNAAQSIPLATWVHATFVRASGTLKIYVNGVLNASGPEGTSTLGYTNVIPKLGTMTYLLQSPQEYNGLYGKMDELRIYNRALSDAEALQLATLPVKLSSFTAFRTGADISLQWKTQYEQNSSHFNIQRSTDGINFTSIGNIQAKGNASTASDYQFTDNTLKYITVNTAVFYRLEQVDKDGRKEYSSIITVKYSDSDALLTILQNPAVDALRLQVALKQPQQVQLQITAADGRTATIKQIPMQAGQTFTALHTGALAPGTYYITIIAAGEKQTLPFIKQ